MNIKGRTTNTGRTWFRKGHIAWNRGTKGLCVAWNKGKKGIQCGWKKGTEFSAEHRGNLKLSHIGLVPHNKGKTLKEEYGENKAKLIKEKLIENHLGKRAGKDSPSWKGGLPHCPDCGKSLSKYDAVRCQRCAGKLRQGVKRPELSGSKSPNWRGGISRLPYPFNFNNELKELIRKRDNYKCQLCGMPEVEEMRKFAIHHIDYDKNNLDPKNLMTLCSRCNSKVNFNRDYYQELFSDKVLEIELVET